MSCNCNQVIPSECRERGWLSSVFDDCILGSGLNGLMGELLPAQARFRLGLHLSADDFFAQGEENVLNEIEGCLYGTGAFHEIRVSATGTFDRYYLIEGKTAAAFAQERDLSALIVGTIQNCAVSVRTVNSVDSLMIDIPAEYPVGPPPGTSPHPSSVPPPPPGSKCPQGYYDAGWLWTVCKPLPPTGAQPEECDLNKQSFSNYVACQLGVTPSTAAMVGVVGALVGVILIAKIAK